MFSRICTGFKFRDSAHRLHFNPAINGKSQTHLRQVRYREGERIISDETSEK